MPAPLVLIATVVGFVLVVAMVVTLNGGRPVDFSGLFPAHGRSDWPQGVQEPDLPRFALDHADALRAADRAERSTVRGCGPVEPAMPRVERVATNVRRLAPRH